MKKNILIAIFVVIGFAFLANTVDAKVFPMQRAVRSEVREETGAGSTTAAARKEIRQEKREQKQNLLENIKDKLKKKFKFEARFTGTITAKADNSLTVATKDGKTYKVNVTSDTKLKRRFWGDATFAELAEGNRVNVFGDWTDDTQTAVNAKVIRDVSIQRRWGAFFGDVTVKNSDNFVMQTVNRGTQTVYFTSTTKFVKRDMTTMAYTDITVGDKVRVKGVWDNSQNKIIEVEEVKDFNLPAQPKDITPTVTPTPTP